MITSANLAQAIVKLVAADALPALVGNLVLGNLVNRDFEPTLSQAGNTVPVRSAQIVLDTHAEASFQIPDVTKVVAVPELLKLYMQPAIAALAERVESDLMALAQQFTANSPLGQGGAPLTEALVEAAETALFTAKVPAGQSKYLVVDPTAYSQLRQIARFSEYRAAGEAGLRAFVEGNVGRINDFYVFRSQFVAKSGNAPQVSHNLAFAKDAIGLAIRRLPQPIPGTGAIAEYAEMGGFGVRVLMSYQPNTLAQQFTVDILYGTGIINIDHGVQVLT